MANPEHLEILKRGVKSWNALREKDPFFKPDLAQAQLSKAILLGVDFHATDLSSANLDGAQLLGAQLELANLCGASLVNTELTLTKLINSKFIKANLSGARFNNAYLLYTNFTDANLMGAHLMADINDVNFSNADLRQAIMGWTKLNNTDLSNVKGLEEVIHTGPSTIGIDTIYRSKGNIPEAFLRGCGVPNEFIVCARSLSTAQNPIQFYSCFISYSSKDQDFANRLHADLQDKGVRCWFAPEDLKIGDKIRDRIDESIRLRDKLLLILSENSIASDWVEHEVESALEEERQRGRTILFPIRLDDAVMESNKAWAALIRRTRHIGDFTSWKDHDSYQKSFDRLLRDLKAEEK